MHASFFVTFFFCFNLNEASERILHFTHARYLCCTLQSYGLMRRILLWQCSRSSSSPMTYGLRNLQILFLLSEHNPLHPKSVINQSFLNQFCMNLKKCTYITDLQHLRADDEIYPLADICIIDIVICCHIV